MTLLYTIPTKESRGTCLFTSVAMEASFAKASTCDAITLQTVLRAAVAPLATVDTISTRRTLLTAVESSESRLTETFASHHVTSNMIASTMTHFLT